jgi:hypothetical protein
MHDEAQRDPMTDPAMPAGTRLGVVLRRAAAWALGFMFAGALYLLLIDITDLPELIVGAGAAAIAATGFELAREQRTVGGLRARLAWLAHVHRRCGPSPPTSPGSRYSRSAS